MLLYIRKLNTSNQNEEGSALNKLNVEQIKEKQLHRILRNIPIYISELDTSRIQENFRKIKADS